MPSAAANRALQHVPPGWDPAAACGQLARPAVKRPFHALPERARGRCVYPAARPCGSRRSRFRHSIRMPARGQAPVHDPGIHAIAVRPVSVDP
jgi:hypothetical protein